MHSIFGLELYNFYQLHHLFVVFTAIIKDN